LSGKGDEVEVGHKVNMFFKITGLSKKLIKSVLKPITQWHDAIKKNPELLRALLGEQEFANLKKDMITLNKYAEQVIRGKGAVAIGGTSTLISILFHGTPLGIASIPLMGFSLYNLYKQNEGNKALKKQGISTKKKP